MGGTEPRDLYDFWYLTEIERLNTEYYKPEFQRKAMNKGHDPAEFEEKILSKAKNLEKSMAKKIRESNK